jgi:hypothetical protein
MLVNEFQKDVILSVISAKGGTCISKLVGRAVGKTTVLKMLSSLPDSLYLSKYSSCLSTLRGYNKFKLILLDEYLFGSADTIAIYNTLGSMGLLDKDCVHVSLGTKVC